MNNWYEAHLPIYELGDVDEAVSTIKRRLGAFPVNDIYDLDLTTRIRGIQQLNNIPVTGYVDQSTLNALDLQV
jgi:hypothetical protein